ncbi:MAG: DNA mismatch repair protein, partial [Candidatus Sungbacteria bacterium]|nr:DNA mismatch repair protein [Candidatus Sungbacteria bacterium]
LYFRFSLIDPLFNIFLNDDEITLEALKDIADKTQFVWNINEFTDPYLSNFCLSMKETIPMTISKEFGGFIASVKKPKDRNIHSTGERVGVDLFVNGRLREIDVLKHIPSARVPESYLYGQLHYNALDGDEVDPFPSGREGVLSDDKRYKSFLEELKMVVSKIIDQWDELREKYREDGDPENTRRTLKERRAGELANAVFAEFTPTEESEQKNKVDGWCGDLFEDARFSFESYADCFVSENLVRKYIQDKSIDISAEQATVKKWRNREMTGRRAGNLTIDIKKSDDDIFYLGMGDLVHLIVPPNDRSEPDALTVDWKQFDVIRNALMHTALLTNEAKRKLTTVYDNIKGKIKNFLVQL